MGRRIVMSLLMLVVFSLAGSAEINLAQADMIDLYNFDFGGDNSPVQNGWLQVTNNTLYSALLGYGWDASVTPSNHTGANPPELPDMLRDFNHGSSARTFEINLAAGTYNITLYFYDTANNSDTWTVYLGNSSTALATVTGLSKDAEVTKQFDITMASAGQLDLRFQKADTGIWQINGISVAQEVPVPRTMLLLSSGLLCMAGLRKINKG